MKISRLFLEQCFLFLISLLLISSKSINKETNKINDIAVLDFYVLKDDKLETIFFITNIKSLLSSHIKEDSLFAFALNRDTDDETIMIASKKGRLYFSNPFSGSVSYRSYIYNSNTLLGNVSINPTY